MSIQPKDATILVVEDNAQNFVLITRLLAFLGVKRCEWKASGWQVLEFAETLPHIDLILMDIFLPEEDGYQVHEKLRAHPRFKDTLIVAVSADVSTENMERARKAGFDGFIGKPIDPDRFPNQIRSILQGEEVWQLD
ncbi:MAG: response regulator [Anaerolineae bacterium]|jgi:two-component system cell cycle response regulator DivK|nr:response regulator [Anaerolineae bacterium]